MPRLSLRPLLALAAFGAGAWPIVVYLQRSAAERPALIQQARLQQFDRRGNVYLALHRETPVGLVRLTYARDAAGALLVQESSDLALPTPDGRVQRIAQHATHRLDAQLRVQAFAVTIRGGAPGVAPQVTRMAGHRIGAAADSLLVIITTAGGTDSVRRAVPPDAVMGSTLWPQVVLRGALAPHRRLAFVEFDLATLATRPVLLTIGRVDSVAGPALRRADEDSTQHATADGAILATYDVEHQTNGLTSRYLLGEHGLPLGAVLPLEVRLAPASLQDIRTVAGRLAALDVGPPSENTTPLSEPTAPSGQTPDSGRTTIIGASAIAAGAPLAAPRTWRHARFLVQGAALPDAAHGAGQSVRGDTVVVMPRRPGRRDGIVDSLSAAERARLTAPEPLVEVRDRRIVHLAQTFAARATSDRGKLAAITAGVHRTLQKAYVPALSSAVGTLQSGAGDCTEHSVLAVALLRAVDVPARVVSGLVGVGDRFFFHAWVEAYVDGRWVAADPTFGLMPADAARLRLASGTQDMLGVVRYLAALRVTPLPPSPPRRGRADPPQSPP